MKPLLRLNMNLENPFQFARKIDRQFPVLGSLVDVDGVRLHVMEAGPEDAPPLLVLHGASGNLRDWTSSIFQDLAKTWRVIVVDRPGYGHSAPVTDGWKLVPQVRVLRAMMHQLGHRRYVLFGHSYSVALVMRWALEHPGEVAGLIAMSGAMQSWDGALGWRYRFGGRSVLGWIVSQMVPMIASPSLLLTELEEVFAPQSVPEGYVDRGGVPLALRPATFALNLRAMDALYWQTQECIAQTDEIICPTEVVHGAADVIVPYDPGSIPIASRIPDSALTLLDGIGHMPHHTAPSAVLSACQKLMDRLDPTEDWSKRDKNTYERKIISI